MEMPVFHNVGDRMYFDLGCHILFQITHAEAWQYLPGSNYKREMSLQPQCMAMHRVDTTGPTPGTDNVLEEQ